MLGFAPRLAQAIRKVLDSKYEQVHVLTDHGFLLIGDVSDADKVTPPSGEWLKRSQRYLLGRNLPPISSLVHVPVRGSADLSAYFPHGIACFVSTGTYHYSHGGPTLQETVIPHIVVQRVLKVSPIRVRLKVASTIHNAVFKVVLEPERRDLFDQDAREVRLIIQRADGRVIFNETEVVDATEAVRKNIKLRPSDGISFGSTLTLVVSDGQTGEELDRKFAIAQVELDV